MAAPLKATNQIKALKRPSPYKIERAVRYATALTLVQFSTKVEVQKGIAALIEQTDGKTFLGELEKFAKCTPKKAESIYRSIHSAFENADFAYDIVEMMDETYPSLMRSVSRPVPFLFTRGDPLLLHSPAISIVGTRVPSTAGVRRAQKLAFLLAERGFVVVSGLAKGIDHAAHVGALSVGGRTIAVIGTPLDISYPAENRELQELIARTNLLVSQFPFTHPVRPYTFPMRNYTMSAISLATVIVEAKQGSGALYQAQYALQQGRKLFIMNHLFAEPGLNWPAKFKGKPGVHVLKEVEDLVSVIGNGSSESRPQNAKLDFGIIPA